MKKTPPKSKKATKKTKSPSTPRKSKTPTSSDNTERPPRNYLSESHRISSERAMDAISKQPWMSAKEAYEDYDRTTKREKYAEPKKKAARSPAPRRKPSVSQNDVPKPKGFLDRTPEEEEALSKMFLESRKEPLEETHREILRNKISSIRSLPGASAREKREMIQMIRAEARLRFDFDF